MKGRRSFCHGGFGLFRFCAASAGLSLFASFSGRAAPCLPETSSPRIADVRALIERNELESATDMTQCILASHPEDTDALRLLSDLLWWQGKTQASEEVACSLRDKVGSAAPFELKRHLAKRLLPSRFALRFEQAASNSAQISEMVFNFHHRFYRKNSFDLGFGRSITTYNTGVRTRDTTASLRVTSHLGEKYYAEALLGVSPTHVKAARFMTGATFHALASQWESDFSAGIERRESDGGGTTRLQGAWHGNPFSQLGVTLQIGATVAPLWAVDEVVSFHTHALDRLHASVFLASGNSLESLVRVEKYNAASTSVRFDLTERLQMGLVFLMHRGNTRTENRAGTNIEWAF